MRKLTIIDFIKKAITKHGDKYDYSLVVYKNNKNKIKIICPLHGVFYQTPFSHLSGCGCYYCGRNRIRDYGKLTKEEFIINANNVHHNKYNYNEVVYVNNRTSVNILCSQHGVFQQRPHTHITGSGCPLCGNITIGVKTKLPLKEFIEKARNKHGDVYDYSNVIYDGMKREIKIICPSHGVFVQTPQSHLSGSGCPACGGSFGERQIFRLLRNNKIDFTMQKEFDSCKWERKLRFDFFIPIVNILIEFQGEQHFMPLAGFGGMKSFLKTVQRDEHKKIWAKENGYILKEYNYKEKWDFIEKNIINLLKNVNNNRDSIHAHKS